MTNEQPDEPKVEEEVISPEAMKVFHDEIRKLYEAEKNEVTSTAHFTYKDGFSPEALGPEEFKLWRDLQSCRAGTVLVDDCIHRAREYQDKFFDGSESVSVGAFFSYLMSELSVILTDQDIADSRKEK